MKKRMIIDISAVSDRNIEQIKDEACQYGAKRKDIVIEKYI